MLGTDGFGRSDSRARCGASSRSTVTTWSVAALKELADEGAMEPERVQEAIERYEIDAEAPMPTTV